MTSFLAFCENPKCGTVFEVTNLIGGAGNITVHMTNTKAGPCPACGASGLIPDGVYQYANQAVSLLTGPETSVRVLQQVHEILKKAKHELISKEDVLEKVEKISPKTAKALQNAPEITNYIQWITILIALIALGIQVHTSYFKEDNIEKEFREHLLQENRELKNKNSTYKRSEPKIQRNSPCPCGSGLKYKKCCGTTRI